MDVSATLGRCLSVEEFAVYLGINHDTVNVCVAKRCRAAHRVGRPCKIQQVKAAFWGKAGGANDNKMGDEV